MSILALAGFGVYDYLGINQGYYQAGYVWQRYLLSVASLVDVPMVQTLVISVGLMFSSKSDVANTTAVNDISEKDVVPAGSD